MFFICDPAYTDRLAAFLRSLGQTVLVSGPNRVEVESVDDEESLRQEMQIYLRVWNVLYPDSGVEVASV